MKNRRRIFVAIALLAIVFSAFSIYALATNDTNTSADTVAHKTAELEGHFLYYNANNKKFEIKKNSEFEAVVDGMNKGDTIKLLSDLHFFGDGKYKADGSTGDSKTATFSTNDETLAGTSKDYLYLDLNGYQLSLHYVRSKLENDKEVIAGNAYVLQLDSNTTVCVYSSDDANKASIHAVHTISDNSEQSNKAAAAFGISGVVDNAHLYIGDIEKANVLSCTINKTGDETYVAVDGKVNVKKCSGDNINTYTPTLFSSGKNSGNVKPAQNSSCTVIGGTHYRVSSLTASSLIYLSTQVDFTAANAKFISAGNVPVVYFHLDKDLAKDKNGTVTDKYGTP